MNGLDQAAEAMIGQHVRPVEDSIWHERTKACFSYKEAPMIGVPMPFLVKIERFWGFDGVRRGAEGKVDEPAYVDFHGRRVTCEIVEQRAYSLAAAGRYIGRSSNTWWYGRTALRPALR